MDAFSNAYRAAVAGDQRTAWDWLSLTRDRDLNEWFHVHAQNTGTFRFQEYGVEPLPVPMPALDPQRRVTKFENELFARDGYRCRYCGVRVAPASVMKRMEQIMGREVFDATSRSNTARHGIKMAFSAALDHVVPHSRGGRTDPDNLVTSCWACNYGKTEYTLTEMGLADPRDFEPQQDWWQGLTDVLICSGCGRGHDPQLIYPHPSGGLWHADFCMPPSDWLGPTSRRK